MIMYSWMNKKLEIKETPRFGKGVFATDRISPNETLFVMGGHIIDIEKENHLDSFQIDKPIEISEEFSFCPMSPEDMDRMPQHYVNHSCEPNAGFKASNFMVAMREILPGEEVVYDYAMIIASNEASENYFTMECLCESAQCRKIIDEEGWKNPILQEKYAGYFQYYVEKLIETSKKGLL